MNPRIDAYDFFEYLLGAGVTLHAYSASEAAGAQQAVHELIVLGNPAPVPRLHSARGHCLNHRSRRDPQDYAFRPA